METLNLPLGERSYPIHIGAGLLDRAELLRPALRARQAMIVSNPTVAGLYLERLQAALADVQTDVVLLPDGESYKSLGTLDAVFTALLEKRHTRHTTLVALGGGVIGDMTGFAAACYQRGVHFVQVPTTLLAQVDSSVGGKTGVNHPLGKNMIGAFHQPRAVLIDTDTLGTLPEREFSAGLAEIIKYGLIGDLPFFAWLESQMDALRAREPEALRQAIATSCRNKARIVAADEREEGVRAWLNLGHSFGHAIETGLGHGTWLHGEAVGCGLVLAARLARRQGELSEAELVRIQALMERAGLPTRPPTELSAERMLELMRVDKKNLHGALRLILPQGLGRVRIAEAVSEAEILAVLAGA
ncbi:MAG: 3-dehydroquinate synthase [Gammaproteobacteria bacterium]|nr:3-dehydroquinate synthase [Gammaproteobacteria bacterium]